jgi:Flp pilus assembly protein CpaB
MAMPAEQPVRQEQVQERSARLGMAYALNPGLRGMAVPLDVIGTVGDFVKPLDHVDVLIAFKEDNKVVVRTLVQDVVVLAIGQTVTAPPPPSSTEETTETSKEPPPPRKAETPVTLALTPAQAQIILTADQAGDLRLTLRGRDDDTVVALPPANSWTMVGVVPKLGPGGPEGGPPPGGPPGAGGPPSVGAQFDNVRRQLEMGGAPGHPAGGAAGAAHPSGSQRPKQPYVEVIRGDATEIVVPE